MLYAVHLNGALMGIFETLETAQRAIDDIYLPYQWFDDQHALAGEGRLDIYPYEGNILYAAYPYGGVSYVTGKAESLPDYLERIGKSLRLARKRKGWSVPHLSKQSGVSQTTIHLCEKGKQETQIGSLFLLAKALETTVGELLR